MGLARATMGVIDYLDTIGSDFRVYDDDEKKVGKFQGQFTDSLDGIDECITSPGFSQDHPLIKKALGRKLPVIDEMEFTYQELNGIVIAVTGTNGKSTTTTLIANILKQSKRVFVGGNIAPGKSYSQALLEPPYDYYILEVSSFQLERIVTFHPYLTVLTNINADHLDRHKTLEDYIDCKFRIFINQNSSDHAILNNDDDLIRERASSVRPIKHFFSIKKEAEAMIVDGKIVVNENEILTVDEIPLKGSHNIANVLASALAGSLLSLKPDQIKNGIVSYSGLPFRMEKIAEKDGVTFINNSMCTNPSAAIASLESMDRPFVVILGGSEKGLPSDDYLNFVTKNARFAVVIGANRERIGKSFKSSGFKNFQIADSMDDAVKIACKNVEPGWLIILNPGYASFDMFKDFEDRGRSFNDAVATI